MNELVDYIKAENEKTRAWVAEDPDNRWAGLVVEDPKHWAEYGVDTVEQYQRYMAIATYVDSYKDVHGIRPSWMNFDDLSLEEIEVMLDTMAEDLEASIELEASDNEYWAMIEKEDRRMSNMLATQPLPYEEYDV